MNIRIKIFYILFFLDFYDICVTVFLLSPISVASLLLIFYLLFRFLYFNLCNFFLPLSWLLCRFCWFSFCFRLRFALSFLLDKLIISNKVLIILLLLHAYIFLAYSWYAFRSQRSSWCCLSHHCWRSTCEIWTSSSLNV